MSCLSNTDLHFDQRAWCICVLLIVLVGIIIVVVYILVIKPAMDAKEVVKSASLTSEEAPFTVQTKAKDSSPKKRIKRAIDDVPGRQNIHNEH